MIKVLILITSISFGLRVLPFIFSKWFQKWPIIEKIGILLPPCILVLLTAHMLEQCAFNNYPYAVPEFIGIGGAVLAQIFFRNLLISMGAGVLCHQLLLRIV